MGAGPGSGLRPRKVSDTVTGTRTPGHRARVPWRLSTHHAVCPSPGKARDCLLMQPGTALGDSWYPGRGEGADSSDKVVTGILLQDASGESPSGEQKKVMGGSSQEWGQGGQGRAWGAALRLRWDPGRPGAWGGLWGSVPGGSLTVQILETVSIF